MIVIRKASESDIKSLKDRLRREDAQEVISAGNISTEACLKESFSRSVLSYCVDIDGVPSAMFGLVPLTLCGHEANVWFLGSDDINKIKKSFVKISRIVIKRFLYMYPLLWNIFPVSYTKTRRWLESMGAVFYEMRNPKGFMLFKIEGGY